MSEESESKTGAANNYTMLLNKRSKVLRIKVVGLRANLGLSWPMLRRLWPKAGQLLSNLGQIWATPATARRAPAARLIESEMPRLDTRHGPQFELPTFKIIPRRPLGASNARVCF